MYLKMEKMQLGRLTSLLSLTKADSIENQTVDKIMKDSGLNAEEKEEFAQDPINQMYERALMNAKKLIDRIDCDDSSDDLSD